MKVQLRNPRREIELDGTRTVNRLLDDLDLKSVPPTSHRLTDDRRYLREDEESPSLDAADALANAPDASAGHFRVPRVMPE